MRRCHVSFHASPGLCFHALYAVSLHASNDKARNPAKSSRRRGLGESPHLAPRVRARDLLVEGHPPLFTNGFMFVAQSQ